MPKINPRIKSIDDLLGLDAAEERPIEPTPSVSLPTKNTIITLPPQAIRAFRGHPFRLYEGDRLNDLVESISEHGVLTPAMYFREASTRSMRERLSCCGNIQEN